jgi:hypothetical protein
MAKRKKRARKRKKLAGLPRPSVRPRQILLDESFLLCASGQGCDSTTCEDEPKDRKRLALTALLMAYEEKVLMVLDDAEPSRVALFYRQKYNLMSRDLREILIEWLNKRTIRRKPAKIKPKVIEDCNLKRGTLDPILCQLAIACHGDAPIWTLDSDFWCASKFYAEIKPICPATALASVR